MSGNTDHKLDELSAISEKLIDLQRQRTELLQRRVEIHSELAELSQRGEMDDAQFMRMYNINLDFGRRTL